MEEVNWSSVNKILNDATRRSILELLEESQTLSYTEIMTILHITNTGKLNYHLKLLGALIAKDEEGKYFLTERGKLSANMVKTFPEKVRVKKNNQTVKIAAAVLLVLLGVALICFAVVVFLETPVYTGAITQTENFSNRTVPQNTTIILTVGLPVQLNASKLSVVWNASNSVHVYLLNFTQYNALHLQQNSTYTAWNFTGLPPDYIGQYDLQKGSVSMTVPREFYSLAVGSSAQATLNSLTFTLQRLPNYNSLDVLKVILLTLVFLALGIALLVLGRSILKRRL